MATQGFSTRSACAVVPLHAPRAGSSLARGCTPGRTALTNIGRRAGGIFILPGGRSRGPRREFLSGLAPGASRRAGGSCSPGARPSFARPAVSPRAGLAEPGHAASARGGRVLNLASRQAAPRSPQRAILSAGEEIPMSQIAPAVGTAPARRLRRPAAHRYAPLTLPGGAPRHARPRGALLFRCQKSPGQLRPKCGGCRCTSNAVAAPSLPDFRLAARASSVGAQIRAQRALPGNIAIACDVSVDRGHELLEGDCDPQQFRAARRETWRANALHDRAFARGNHPCRVPGSVAQWARVSAFSTQLRGRVRNTKRKVSQ